MYKYVCPLAYNATFYNKIILRVINICSRFDICYCCTLLGRWQIILYVIPKLIYVLYIGPFMKVMEKLIIYQIKFNLRTFDFGLKCS